MVVFGFWVSDEVGEQLFDDVGAALYEANSIGDEAGHCYGVARRKFRTWSTTGKISRRDSEVAWAGRGATDDVATRIAVTGRQSTRKDDRFHEKRLLSGTIN